MSQQATDERWMRAALALARRGLGRTWPNPAEHRTDRLLRREDGVPSPRPSASERVPTTLLRSRRIGNIGRDERRANEPERALRPPGACNGRRMAIRYDSVLVGALAAELARKLVGRRREDLHLEPETRQVWVNNVILDRAMLVGTPDQPEIGFFADLLDEDD